MFYFEIVYSHPDGGSALGVTGENPLVRIVRNLVDHVLPEMSIASGRILVDSTQPDGSTGFTVSLRMVKDHV